MIEFFEEPLPPWAIDVYKGVLVPGLQLSTRDGRRVGNAVIIETGERYSIFKSWEVSTVVTDIGNKLELSTQELWELFHEPEWVMDFREHNGYKVWQEDIRLYRD